MKRYAKRFFEIQIRLAERLVQLTNENLGTVLLKHTVFRQLLGVSLQGEDHLLDPTWQEFVEGTAQQSDRTDWAYNFYLNHPEPADESEQPRFGCFTYDYYFQPVVRLHFGNLTYDSVLDKGSVATRQAELNRLFTHVQQHHPEAERVRGSSWLYNIEAYRRLFPPEYVVTAKPVGYETGFFSLWGQFLRADRSIRESAANQFLACLAIQTDVDGCMKCFPHQVLRPECPIHVFYSFYFLRI